MSSMSGASCASTTSILDAWSDGVVADELVRDLGGLRNGNDEDPRPRLGDEMPRVNHDRAGAHAQSVQGRDDPP
jgi:hypothetical protein